MVLCQSLIQLCDTFGLGEVEHEFSVVTPFLAHGCRFESLPAVDEWLHSKYFHADFGKVNMSGLVPPVLTTFLCLCSESEFCGSCVKRSRVHPLFCTVHKGVGFGTNLADMCMPHALEVSTSVQQHGWKIMPISGVHTQSGLRLRP